MPKPRVGTLCDITRQATPIRDRGQFGNATPPTQPIKRCEGVLEYFKLNSDDGPVVFLVCSKCKVARLSTDYVI